jgi:hypothetical protein
MGGGYPRRGGYDVIILGCLVWNCGEFSRWLCVDLRGRIYCYWVDIY